MKIFLGIAGAIIVVLIAVGAWLLFFGKPSNQPLGTLNPPFPVSTSTGSMGTGTSVQLQNDPNVTAALGSQLPGSDFQYYGTVTVLPYALQNWGDQNAGNEALLRYDQASGWTVVSTGGGAWDVASLEADGVPELTAEELLAGEQ